MSPLSTEPSVTDIFGPPIDVVTRAQLLEDGVLVDLTQADAYKDSGIRFPVAITRTAYALTVEVGGRYVPDPNEPGSEILTLPGGQSVTGRLTDVLWLAHCAMRRAAPNETRAPFEVRVDTTGNGRRRVVRLYAQVGPGDSAEPVITILLEGED